MTAAGDEMTLVACRGSGTGLSNMHNVVNGVSPREMEAVA
jgi:hypothetical protein